MLQKFSEFCLKTNGQQLLPITNYSEDFLGRSGIKFGLLNISILHTSASLLIQENVSKDVLQDLLRFYDNLVPMNPSSYTHTDEGMDDMPAHIKTSLTSTNLTLSVIDAQISLGVWQGIFLFEHRITNQERKIIFHVMGE